MRVEGHRNILSIALLVVSICNYPIGYKTDAYIGWIESSLVKKPGYDSEESQ